jgi:hypothetical protein
MGVKNATSARRSLQNAGVVLEVISSRAFAVDEEALAAYIAKRAAAGGFAPGRPDGIHTPKRKKSEDA